MYINVYLSCKNTSLSQFKKRNWQHYCRYYIPVKERYFKINRYYAKICSLHETVHDSNDLECLLTFTVKYIRPFQVFFYV